MFRFTLTEAALTTAAFKVELKLRIKTSLQVYFTCKLVAFKERGPLFVSGSRKHIPYSSIRFFIKGFFHRFSVLIKTRFLICDLVNAGSNLVKKQEGFRRDDGGLKAHLVHI